MTSLLADFPHQHHASGQGLYSVCSAHTTVLEAAIEQAKLDDSLLLVEATSNQVDQFGGYTGMTPHTFRSWLQNFAKNLGFSPERLILGGDHLGPNPWRKEPADKAMGKAQELVKQYASAGFGKIHLDCSMSCADDTGPAPSQETVAARAALLCQAAEKAAAEAKQPAPVYVIGTEVPVPGGAAHELEDALHPTRVEDAAETLTIHQETFKRAGLEDAWQRVIALVVQPGVEFGNYTVAEYCRDKAQDLSAFIAKYPGLVFEAHSTDYQSLQSLTELVEDHYAILKVGPWLTYAYREALFGLTAIAEEMGLAPQVRTVIEQVMLQNPGNWQGHYHGSAAEEKLARAYSFSDRIRYYWLDQTLQQVVSDFLRSMTAIQIPLSLLSQYLPHQYDKIREGRLSPTPHAILKSAVSDVLCLYAHATKMSDKGALCRK